MPLRHERHHIKDPALRSKVANLRIEDSQNLANANYSNLPLLWQAAVKDA
jgi:hypothetical protein